MHFKSTLQKMGGYLQRAFFIFLLGVCTMSTNAQTTISVESGTGYTGLLGIVGGNACITFGIQNSNATVRTLTAVDMSWDVFFTTPSADATLWYTTSSLSGAPTIATPAWTQIATVTGITPVGGIIPTFTGLSFTLAANTEYRFAVSTTNGVAYSPAAATPNTFSADGVTLRTNNFQIGGLNTGYAGAFPSPGNNPRAFTGRITFIDPAPACSGTPDPGNTNSTVTQICPGLGIGLSFTNSISGSGVTYQWERSTTGVGGPFTPIAGATNITLTTSQTVATHYRVAATCSGNTGYSVPVFVDMAPSANCYCVAGSTDVDPTFEKISNVTFGSLNNSSTSVLGYEDFSAVAPPSFEAGVTAPIVITGSNTYGGDRVRVWIDFNQNGNFNDAGELVYASALGAGPYNGNITFPATAVSGTTKMRIRLYDDIFGNGNATPCGDNTYGQVEDYTLNITPCIPGTISSQPVSVTTNCGGTTTFSVTAAGTALTYQWQERVNATSPWVIVANGGIYSGATTSTLTIAGVPGTSNGHQFQVAVGGPCTPVFLSSVATLTVNPLVATVNTPLPINRCSGDPATQISVTNASGATTTLSVASGPLALAIPETSQAGINNIINVTTVPSGVNVVGLSVRLNVTHTWAGDLVAVLKAPNGQIINLVALLDGTGGAGPTTGFTNTVISSTGVTVLDDAATQPFTGTFAANLYLNQIVGLGAGYYDPMPVGPTGFLPTTANWNNLFSTANGDWTLAIYDGYDDSGAPGQPVNTLNNWAINITYGTPADGVFTPSTGLFTDPAGTIDYTGTAINTVYAAPGTTTNYSLVVTTAACVSTPLDVQVIVNNPITGTSTVPAAFAGCVGGSTTITSSTPTSGNDIAHQWMVSTDNGATYTNVNNGGSYSGANTATLTISGITTALDGNLYKDSLFVTSCNSNTVTNASELTVNPVPTVTITAAPANTQFYPGLTTTLTAASSTSASVYKWYKNGVLIPGANGSTLFVDVDGAGDYTVTITDANGCSGTSAATTITTVSNDVLFIYPSPNTGQFQVRYYNTDGNTTNIRTLSVYDSKGARVYSKVYDINQPYTRMDVDMRNYSKGVYRVELGDRNGKRLKTGSVLIQ